MVAAMRRMRRLSRREGAESSVIAVREAGTEHSEMVMALSFTVWFFLRMAPSSFGATTVRVFRKRRL